MKIKVLAFGIAKDILGGSTLTIEMQEQPTADGLKKHLCGLYPDFEHLASLSIAVNAEYADGDQLINAGDEVVIIPPVSGG
jgi:molybdopterin synthase sulfur carrier subunit